MIGSILGRALNIPALLRHRREALVRAHDVGTEPELALYSRMFGAEYLHAGYFRQIPADAQAISLSDVREAMHAYSELVLDRVAPGEQVLDVGCGVGGMLRLLRDKGAQPTGLTPSAPHAEFIRRRDPDLPVIVSGFQDLDVSSHAGAFDAVLTMESFQNVPLEAGMRNMRAVLKPGGRWIAIGYYRLREQTYNRSGHLLSAFRDALAKHGFRVTEEIDVTANTVPTLAFAHTWASHIGLPLADYAAARFFRKHPILEYLLQDVVDRARARMRLDALDPEVFARDKCYLLQQIVP